MAGNPNAHYMTTSPDSIAIVEAIKTMAATMAERISKTETDFVSHLQKVEARLDQLVDLTRSVAVIQTQASTQAEQMTELRTQIQMLQSRVDGSISRIHTRMDEISEQFRAKIDLKQMECDKQVDEVSKDHDALDREVRAWYNYGRGLWALFCFVVGIGGWSINKAVEVLAAEKTQLVAEVQRLSNANTTNDVRMTQILGKLQDHLDEHAGRKRQ